MTRKKQTNHIPSTEEIKRLLKDFGEKDELLSLVKSKRARVVLEHILEHGYITTKELRDKYKYEHPPRAARDVKEAGIPLRTIRIKAPNGRTIAAYTLGDLSKIRKLRGRHMIPKTFKEKLYELSKGKCAICQGHFKLHEMQVDHRIPFEILGDTELNVKNYMLLCGPCNRAKSWSCENCPNWSEKNPKICSICYWANPENYTHIALREIRRMDLVWTEKEIQIYEKLKKVAQQSGKALPDYVKTIIKKNLNAKGTNNSLLV